MKNGLSSLGIEVNATSSEFQNNGKLRCTCKFLVTAPQKKTFTCRVSLQL